MTVLRLGLVAMVAGGCIGGVKPFVLAREAANEPAAPDTILRLHWLGKERLAKETNAATFMGLWNLPESKRLEAQTLDKFAQALASSIGRALTGKPSTLNPGSLTNLLRPLLDDLLREESYLEVRQAGGQPCDLAVAIRLQAHRAALWETNLAAVFESLPGAATVSAPGAVRYWQLPVTPQPARGTPRLSLARAGEWTILGLAPSPSPQTSTLDQFLARLQHAHAPFSPPATHYWLEADLEPRQLVGALAPGWHLPEDLPRLSVSVIGDGATTISRADLNFPAPLRLALDPWDVPTNLVCGAVTSFSALRGLQSCLAALPAWKKLALGSPPKEFYSWALVGPPMQTYLAAPLDDASNQVCRLADLLLEKAGPWFASNSAGVLRRSPSSGALEWQGLALVSPFLRSVVTNRQAFVLGGLFPAGDTSLPLAPELLRRLDQTNLVAYDWELTGVRVDEWFQIGQSLRLAAKREQLPGQCAAAAWLKAAAPKLWPSVTEVTQTGPARLSLKRRSSLGLTGIELHLLADWLESPRFPHGSYTLFAPPFHLDPGPLPPRPGAGK